MRSLSVLLPLALAATPANAAVIDFTFSQSGFGGGGQITGFFSGEDLDGDGQLSSFADEITAFGVSFSGNATVSAFSLGFQDLFGLVYDLGDPLLGNGRSGDFEGILAENGSAGYLVGPGPLLVDGACLNGALCGQVNRGDALAQTSQLVVVAGPTAAIPEPASWALMIGGFGLAGTALRTRRSAGAAHA
jgi:hypothetical protein